MVIWRFQEGQKRGKKSKVEIELNWEICEQVETSQSRQEGAVFMHMRFEPCNKPFKAITDIARQGRGEIWVNLNRSLAI